MITVFTPTYNRKYIIDNLYQSLLRQTNKDFEWLIVDDGSTDDTQSYFEQIMAIDNPFEIRYIKQENGGKHRAINRAVPLARGELFFIVDSDDYLTDNAIEKIKEWHAKLDNSHKFAGISGLKGYNENEHVGDSYTKSKFIDARNTERKEYNLLGDKAEVYFIDVLKKYPFPEFDGEKFITEEVVWNAIAHDGYYLRWYNEIIYICDYLEDGLTRSGNTKNLKNPQGVLYWTKQQLKIFSNSTRKKFSAVNIYYETVKMNKKMKEVSSDIGISCIYCRIAIFVSKLFYLKRKLFKKGK